MEHTETCFYSKDGYFQPNCPRCMEIWCKFLEEKNCYVVTDKIPKEKDCE